MPETVTARAAVVLLLLVVLGGCTVAVEGVASPAPGAAGPARPGAFGDDLGRFDLVPPPGWTVDTSGAPGTAVVFRDPRPVDADGGPFSVNINVLVVPSAGELPDTVAGARQELRGLPGYTAATDRPATLPDGTAAHLLGGTFRDARYGFALHNLQLFAVHGDSTVVVTGTSPVGTWGSYEALFTDALSTLVVEP